jgi:hypothetical protein
MLTSGQAFKKNIFMAVWKSVKELIKPHILKDRFTMSPTDPVWYLKIKITQLLNNNSKYVNNPE